MTHAKPGALVVSFSTGRTYTHAVQDTGEAQRTLEGWQRGSGLWVIDDATRSAVWCPWHTVTEVTMPRPAHLPVGGAGPAVRGTKGMPAKGSATP